MLFALWVIANINACQEKDAPIQETDFTSDELAEMTAADKYSAANSVYRALALIDELPDDWESVT